MSALGSLVVRLSLEYAAYTQGLDKSSQEALKFAKGVQSAVDGAKAATSDFLGSMVTGAVAAVASYQTIQSVIDGVRQSIDRLDEISKISQRVGIASDTLQELAYAGELADVNLEALATGAKKLSQAMLEAATGGKEQAAVFKAIGVEVKTTSGTLRNSNDVMADVADVFAGLEDGAVKTALAVKIFGKAGADMIPLLNGGKKAFQESAEEARKFGLVIGDETLKAAEAFNDNMTRLGKVTQGTFNQIAQAALPVLVAFSEAMVQAASDTQSLNQEAQRLGKDGTLFEWAKSGAIGLTYVMDAAEGVWRVLKGLGQLLGGLIAAAANNIDALATAFLRLQSGDFSGAFQAIRSGVSGLGAIVSSVGDDLSKTFSDQLMGDKIRERIKDLKAFGNATEDIGKKAKPSKAQLDALTDSKGPSDAQNAMEKWVDELTRYQNELDAAAGDAEKLTRGEKLMAQLLANNTKEVKSLTQADRDRLQVMLQTIIATERRLDRDERARKATAEAAKLRVADIASLTKAAEAAEEQARAERESIAVFGLSKDAIMERNAARLEEQATLIELQAIKKLDRDLDEQAYDLAIRQATAIRDRAASMRQGAYLERQEEVRKAAEENAKTYWNEWKQINDQIGQGLAEALMNGGKSAADYLRGLFRQLVLQPLLRPLVAPIASFIASATAGSSAFASDGTSTASQLGTLANSYSALSKAYEFYTGSGPGTLSGNFGAMYGEFARSAAGQYLGLSDGAAVVGNNASAYVAPSLTTTGSTVGSVASAAGGVVAGHFIGRSISGGYAAGSGSGNTNVNVGTAIGAVVGSIIPVIGTALGAAIGGAIGGLVNRAFGHKAPEIEAQGFEGTFSGSGFSGNTFQDILEKGGWFRSDRRSTVTGELFSDVDKALDAGAAAVRDSVKKYGDAVGLPADQLLGISTQIRVKITEDADANAKAIGEALGKYSEALLAAYEDDIEPFRRAGEKVGDTIARLGGSLLTVNDSLSKLGLQQIDKSLTGGQAAFDLTELFGGADSFQQAVTQFYQTFTTGAQRTQDLSVDLGAAFTDLGLTMPSVTDGIDSAHASYKELLKAQDLTTESGRKTFAALIGLSGAFDILAQTVDAQAKQAAAQSASLEIELLRATGREMEAVALERQIELEQLRELEKSLNVASGAFTSVQEAIYAAVDAAEAQARQQRIQGGLDSVVGDFLKGDQLAGYLSQRVLDLLGEGGITGDIAGVMGSTRDTIVDLWNAVGTEGKEAILEAYPVWQQLMEVINGTTDAIKEYREGALADAISEAGFASLKPSDRIRELKNSAEFLKDQIANGDDPVDAAQRLQQVYGWIFEAEDELNAERLESLGKEIEAQKKLKELSADLLKYTKDLRAGDLSPYGSAQQLGYAEEAFNDTLRRVRSGDSDAAGSLIGSANAYLKEASDRFASGPQFASIFENVADTLESLGLSIEADPQLELLQDQYDELEALKNNSGRMLEALLSIDALLGGRVGEVIDASNEDEVTTGDVTPIRIESGTIAEVAAAIGATPAQAQANAELQRISAAIAQLVIQTARTGEVAETSEQHLAVSREGAVGIIASVNRLEERMAAIERFVRQENF